MQKNVLLIFHRNEIVAVHPYFDGCVSELSLNGKNKNILTNYVSKVGTVSGCKLVKRAVTFKQAEPDDVGTDRDTGYVQVKSVVIFHTHYVAAKSEENEPTMYR